MKPPMNKILFRLIIIQLAVIYCFPGLSANDTTYIVEQKGNFSPITGVGIPVDLDYDQISESLPIGFDFKFFGKAYTQFFISSNGFITFTNNGDPGYGLGQALPDTTSPNNLVAFSWNELYPKGGSINYFTTGSYPLRKLVVNFINVPHLRDNGESHGGDGNLVTAQVILHEGSNIIDILSNNMTSNGGPHTMGIENETGTLAYTVPGRNSTDWSVQNDFVRFMPVIGSKNDAGVSSLNLLDPFCTGNNSIIAQVQNYGENVIHNVTVNWMINGVLQSPVQVRNLNPFGENDASTQVTLGTKMFQTNETDNIAIWTSGPNGLPDTVNYNDTLSAIVGPSLTGSYTIGGSNPSFPTINQAVTEITNRGVCGSVVFKIRNGTYNEQISIPEIKGTSKTSTITFESESGDSGKVILLYSGSYEKNYTLQLQGANYVTFQKITISALNGDYGRVIDLSNGSNHNTFASCILLGNTSNNSATESSIVYCHHSANNYNIFRNNEILNGSYGIYYDQPESADLSKGIIIENNILENQHSAALYFYSLDSLTIVKNTINTSLNSYGYQHIYCRNCNNYLKIEKNKLSAPNLYEGQGIYLENCQGTSSAPELISNNFVQLGGTGTTYGIFLNASSYQEIYNNNIDITDTSDYYGSAINVSSCDHINLKNNIFVNTGGGYALYTNSPSNIESSDYNDLYATGRNIAYWSTDQATLKGLQITSEKDTHSISTDPMFISQTDLHVREVWLNGVGSSLPEISDDIDNEPRNASKPDIGADEFNPPQTDAGLYSLESPKTPFLAGNKDIIVILKNFGKDTLKTVHIDWAINSSQPTRVNWSGKLAPADTIFVKLGTYLFNTSTTYNIKCWSSLPNGSADMVTQNDTIRRINLSAGLSGIYTIGGTNPDFSNFHAAMDALVQGGIVGTVTFKVRNGIYNEQISIPEIKGTNKSRTITFESETGDSTRVTLSYMSNNSTNYTIQLNGASYITFRKMTLAALSSNYARVICVANTCSNNRFESNIIINNSCYADKLV